jgi:hypothetical protein
LVLHSFEYPPDKVVKVERTRKIYGNSKGRSSENVNEDIGEESTKFQNAFFLLFVLIDSF